MKYSLGHLGGILGGLGVILGFWGRLGGSWADLGNLEGFWGDLGGFFKGGVFVGGLQFRSLNGQ